MMKDQTYFYPTFQSLVRSGEILMNGRPTVIFIALKLKSVFIGVNIVMIHSNDNIIIIKIFMKKNVSDENGLTLIPLCFNDFIVV